MTEKPSHKLSRYVHVIESRLIPNQIQYGIFHQFTGDVFYVDEKLRALLAQSRLRNQCLTSKELEQHGLAHDVISELIEKQFLVPAGYDPLHAFRDYYVTRPRQNPALAFKSSAATWRLVRLSMTEKIYSPAPNTLPPVIEEDLSQIESQIFLAGDGKKTLAEILSGLRSDNGERFDEYHLGSAIDNLTTPERQLIKFAEHPADLANPFMPCNIVPRNLYHAARWSESANVSIKDFHRTGIGDALWEFDMIEPTVNHALRFPTEVLGGLDYGSRFWQAIAKTEITRLKGNKEISVLEVGGGTGTFAHSLIGEARRSTDLKYHILELSPALMAAQRRNLSDLEPPIEHFQQDATDFELDKKFDLIVANEVAADFPVAEVRVSSQAGLAGPGANFIHKYNLPFAGAPERFVVNGGLFQFIERAWQHLLPGGALVFSEYSSMGFYPAETFHLNHSEFSIHFGHALQCGQKLGFECQLISLKDFLAMDFNVSVLNGREEHIRCLNHVLGQYGEALPFAIVTEREIMTRFASLIESICLTGFSFAPISDNFCYGPNISDFMVMVMVRPVTQ